MKYYKVTYDFVASDPAELSVKQGELLCAAEHIEHDGWLKVEVASDTRRRGYVPLAYIKESERGVDKSHSEGGSFTDAAQSLGIALRESQGAVHHDLVVQPSSHVLVESSFASNPAPSVVDAFMKNEVYFKQLMKQRQEALSKIEGMLADAAADVGACKDKNATLARKLRDLDQNIERERRRWKERVDEEKLLIQRCASSAAASFPDQLVSRTVRSLENSNSPLRRL